MICIPFPSKDSSRFVSSIGITSLTSIWYYRYNLSCINLTNTNMMLLQVTRVFNVRVRSWVETAFTSTSRDGQDTMTRLMHHFHFRFDVDTGVSSLAVSLRPVSGPQGRDPWALSWTWRSKKSAPRGERGEREEEERGRREEKSLYHDR